MIGRVRTVRRAFLVSASFPIAAVLGAVPAVAQTVTVDAPTTTNTVNTKIGAAIAASRDLKVDVTAAGAIKSDAGTASTVVVNPGAGQGDGTVTFTNAGKIGTLNADGTAVTDSVGVTLNGAPTKTDNNVTLTNSGLITGGVNVGTFGAPVGGNATFSNLAGGQIFNGVSLVANGNIKADVATGSTISSGSLNATNLATTKSATADGVTTTTQTSGANTLNVAGNIVSVDGKTRGSVNGASLTSTTIAVAGKAGTINAVASGATTSTTLAAPGAPAAGKTVTTVNSSTTQNAGVASVTVTGDTLGINSRARTTNTVAIDGKVGGDVFAGFDAAFDSKSLQTVTQDDKGVTTATTGDSSSVAVGPATTVAIGQTGALGLATIDNVGAPVIVNVTAQGVKSATVTNAGSVVGSISASTTSSSTNSSFSTKTASDGKGNTSDITVSTNTPAGGAATVSVAAGGSVGGLVNGQTIGGGNVSANSNAGPAAVTNAGVIRGSVVATSQGTSTTSTNSNKTEVFADPAATQITTSNVTERAATGATASLSNEATGVIDGSVFLTGDTGATLSNAGVIGKASNGQGGNTVSLRSQRNLQTLSQSSSVNKFTADGLSNTGTSSSKNVSQAVGGPVSFTNAQTGLVSGEVSLTSATDITIANAGTVRGRTNASTFGSTTTSTADNAFSTVTTLGKAPALDTTVSSNKSSSSSTSTNTAGSIAGTYSGTNGTLNFTPAIDGSITQNAAKDSTATVSGTVFGSLNSFAGNGFNSSSSNTNETTSTLDSAGTGSRAETNSSKSSSSQVAGASAVTISGLVGDGNASSAAVSSSGSSKANLALSGKIEGSASVSSFGVQNSTTASSRSLAQTVTKNANRTTALTETSDSSTSVTGGSATADLTGKASVLGSLSVTGNTDAAATVASTAAIGSKTVTGFLSVSAGSADNSSISTTSTYAFDTKTKLGSATTTTKSTSGPSAETGIASAKVAGTVFGSTSVTAPADASIVLTGVSRDGAFANAGDQRSESTSSTERAGIPQLAGGASFSDASLGLTTKTNSFSQTTTNILGKASVSVATPAELQTTGTAATENGGVNANGTGGATVTVAAGSIVRGGASATATGAQNATFTQTETFTFDPTFTTENGKALTFESKQVLTPVGGAASIANAGIIENGGVSAFGQTSATVDNTGKLGSAAVPTSVVVQAGGTAQTTTVSRSGLNNPALQREVTTTTNTTVGGDAKFTNAAGASLFGNLSVAGKTGSVVNNGLINGTTTLGTKINDFTKTETKTAGTTVTEFTLPTTRPVQTYTVDQNGISRGFVVTGTTVTPPDGAGGTKTLQTSDINATINLNKGSATLGSISAEVDTKTGARLTNTTVNLNGSGFLGADYLGSGTVTPANLKGLPTPLLILPEKVGPLFGVADGSVGFGPAVTVRGVANLNKTGAGTFVLTGAPYVAPTTPGCKAQWTLDIGALNNQAGELQLALPVGSDSKTEFGILGNVNNDAALVLGRRVPATVQLVGDSLVNAGPETIDGIKVRQQGNFVQSKSGALVVGLTPSLVRFGNVSVGTGGSAPEPLGPVGSGVAIPFFTTPANAGIVADNSFLGITGNLDLGGTVAVDLTRDSLFTAGDGYTLITYTGTGNVSATVTPALSSKFVNFALVHDTAAKTVSIRAARTSYASGATDPNAAAAAAGLDSTLTSIVNAIRTDASGGAGFSTVSRIGFAQDVANIATALDFRLNAEQAAQVFRELSSAEIYGSLSSLDQNVAFGETVKMLTVRKAQGGELGTSLWAAPIGNFARYGGTSSGASRIKATSYGASFGIDIAYSEDGVFGVGGAYAEHDVNARGTPEEADARTWTIGAYAHQRFDRFYANALFAYGFTRFNVERDLQLLARTINASFRGNQLDASLEVGYDFDLGNLVATPFAKAAVRRFSMNGFTEENGGGIGLVVDGRSKSIFSPVIGARLGGTFDAGTVAFRPFIRGSFTFQGDLGADRSVTYLAGGTPFTLIGVRPSDYGTIDLGFDSDIGQRLNLFLAGGYSFGGSNKVGSIRGGVNFKF